MKAIFILVGALVWGHSTVHAQNTLKSILNPCMNVFSCTPRLFKKNLSEEHIKLGMDTVWATRYVGEGVDLWEDSGIIGATLRATYKDFSVKTWYGVSDNGSNFGELKFRAQYIKELEKWTIMPWFEQSFVFPGNNGIPRPGIKTTYHLNETYFVGTDLYWQHNNNVFRGYYSTFFGGQVLLTKDLMFNTTIRYGYNGGYVGPTVAHGSNAIDYFTTLAYKVNDSFSFDIFVNYAQALTSLKQADKGNLFYYGFNLHFEF